MKQTFILLILFTFFGCYAKAQQVSIDQSLIDDTANTSLSADTTLKSISSDTSIVRIGKKDVQVINHRDGGSEIYWGKHKHGKRKGSNFDGHWEGLEIGFNSFDKADYSLYDPIDKDFMSLNQGKSIEIDFNFYELNVSLAKSYVGLVSGLGLGFNSYRFENPYTIVREQEMTQPVYLDTEKLEKTKLAVSYLKVPLLLEFQIPVNQNEGRLFINAGVIGGVKIGSHTKVKHDGTKDKDHSGFNLNSFKYEATGRIGYKGVSLFANYSLTPLFQSGKGPDLTPFTVGISFVD
jgi:hypothetical protein